jgi:kynurenine formamidase
VGNWGQWGSEDQWGGFNFITPSHLVKAATLVKKGNVYSLGLPIRRSGVPCERSRNPALHLMKVDGGDYAAGATPPGGVRAADDYLLIACHGTTHIDALAHVWTGEHMYNGFPGGLVRSSGAHKLAIDNVRGIVTRGVLLDVATYKGVPHLAGGYAITSADLDACAKAQGTAVGPGDVLLVRTGWHTVFSRDPEVYHRSQPGLGTASVRWIIERNVVAVGADNIAVEVDPTEDGKSVVPIHVELIRNHGVYLIELLDLEELGRDRVFEFMFVAAPLRIVGGVGSPLNPLAIC